MAPHPVRDLAQNLADLRAQVAANARGVAGIQRMIAEFGLPVVTAYMRHVQDNAAEAVRRVLDRLSDDPEAHRFTQGIGRRQLGSPRASGSTGKPAEPRSTSAVPRPSAATTSTPRPR